MGENTLKQVALLQMQDRSHSHRHHFLEKQLAAVREYDLVYVVEGIADLALEQFFQMIPLSQCSLN